MSSYSTLQVTITISESEDLGLDNLPSDARSSLSIGSHDVNEISSASWSDDSSSLFSSVQNCSSSDDKSSAEYRSNNNDKSRPKFDHIIPDTDAEPNTSRILATDDICRVKEHKQNSFIDHNIDWKSPIQCCYSCLVTCDNEWIGLVSENYNPEELQRRH